MKIISILVAILTATVIIIGGLFVYAPLVLSGRVAPGIQASLHNLTGIAVDDLPPVVKSYAQDIINQPVTLTIRAASQTYRLRDLGVDVNQAATIAAIRRKNIVDSLKRQTSIKPIITISQDTLRQRVNTDFTATVNSPQDATLVFSTNGQLTVQSSHAGEVIDLAALQEKLISLVEAEQWGSTINLTPVIIPAQVQEDETDSAKTYAKQLLKQGFTLTFNDETFTIRPSVIKRLLEFSAQDDPDNPTNKILGVKFNAEGLNEYLRLTISPAIDQPAQNARFVMRDGRVEQFSLPQSGQQLDVFASANEITAALAQQQFSAPLAVIITQPAITNQTDIKELGLNTKISTGISNFAGSPTNRKHNIAVGASRYHGLLIPPNTEFSFNEFLGPVNADAGFKPELVIKENVTIPEYGGGLCQVSTTAFRAALNAGLKITQRRNHSYAVSYYGKPGLDATIYPPYTDFRFLNNTPGYILIQTRIDGTKLVFDFWGTDDGRQVTINGPVTYDRQPDGSVKAYVEQKVTHGDETIIDETFYSRYKSPKLFPHVLAANGETVPQVNASSGQVAGATTNRQLTKQSTDESKSPKTTNQKTGH